MSDHLWPHRPVALVAVLALLVAACAPSTETDGTSEPEATVTGEGAETGSVFIYAHPTTFPDFDPSTGFSNDSAVNSSVYETLVRYNSGGDPLVTGVLASDWRANEDSTVWTFTLRDDVTFHDGSPLTAEAVKASVERTLELGQGAAFIWDPVESIEAVDELTVRFNLSYPAPVDLIASAGYGAYVFSPSCVEGRDAAWFNEGNDCGSGPYTFSSYEPGQRAVLEAYPEYWGGWSESQFDTVILQVVEDPTVRQQMIGSGEADFTYEIPIDNLPTLEEDPSIRMVANPAFQNLLAFFNTEKPPLDDPRLREALAHAFPFDLYIENVMQGFAEQSHGVVPRGLFGFSEAVPQFEYDLDQAQALLEETGMQDLSLTLTYATGDQSEAQMAELWKAELDKVGVDLQIQPMTWEAQWDLAKSDPAAAQDVFVMYWWPTYPTPYDFLFSMFHSEDEPFFNLSYYDNQQFDQTIDEANVLLGTDREQAQEMFITAQEMLHEDAPAIPIFDQQNIHVIRADIQGYEDNPAYPHVAFFYELSR